ncbi:MAG: nucleotidyltransferase domain-containing protein [Thermomicrobiales bacterium]
MKEQPSGDRDKEVLAEIVRRIVRVAAPERIVLFGSAARGAAGPGSDLDLLVIKPGRSHRGRLTEEIYLSLIGVGHAVDVVVVTPEDIDCYQDAQALVIAPALREGRVIYAAQTPAA